MSRKTIRIHHVLFFGRMSIKTRDIFGYIDKGCIRIQRQGTIF